MAKVLFKSPKVEITKLDAGDTAPSTTATWTEVPSSGNGIKQDSVAIATTAGTNSKAFNDLGVPVASHTSAAQYAINLSTYAPITGITDTDGVVSDEYAIRVTERSTGNGYIMERAEVSVSINYTASDAATNAYVFNGLAPTSGNTLKPYTAPEAE